MRNIMRTSGRIRIAEYAYRSTLQKLDAEYAPPLARLRAPRPEASPRVSLSKAPRRPEAARTGSAAG